MDLDLNLVVIAGRLAAAPEMRTFDSGARMLRLLVTVRSENPHRRIDVIPVTWWDPPIDVARTAFSSGDRVWVSGALQRRFWEAAEGRRSRIEVVASHLERPDRPLHVVR